jgi:UDP-glucose 4-epimerase
LDNLSTGFKESLLQGEELVVGDIRDAEILKTLFSRHHFSAVLHFAASIVVPDSVANPLSYYENNTSGTLQLLKATVRHEIHRFVFSSTAAVYGEIARGPIAETAEVHPANPYGRSKLMDEWILSDVAKAFPLRYVVLRYFNVAGADPEARIGQRFPKATHLIKVACEAVVGKRAEVTVFGEDYPTPDGTGIRDYIHVEDLASAHLAALKYLEAGELSTTFNCGYGHGYSVREVLDEVRKQGGEFRVVGGPRRAGDVASLVADVSAIGRTLDWKPRYANLPEIVRHALAFERRL